VLANGATIRPVGTKASVAQVTWVNAKELLLTSNMEQFKFRWTVVMSRRLKRQLLPHGNPTEAASPGQNGLVEHRPRP